MQVLERERKTNPNNNSLIFGDRVTVSELGANYTDWYIFLMLYSSATCFSAIQRGGDDTFKTPSSYARNSRLLA